MLGWMLLMILMGLYLIPTWVAFGREHHDKVAILFLNLLLGWSVLGWIIALVWALTAVRRELNSTPRSW
jgi:ABC-type transport system involved in cytochrome c biogenesis permease component